MTCHIVPETPSVATVFISTWLAFAMGWQGLMSLNSNLSKRHMHPTAAAERRDDLVIGIAIGHPANTLPIAERLTHVIVM